MGHWKSNILFALLMLGGLGYLITIDHQIVEFTTSPTWISYTNNQSIIGTITGMILYAVVALVYLAGVIVYVFRWFIVIGVVILWTAAYMSRRN